MNRKERKLLAEYNLTRIDVDYLLSPERDPYGLRRKAAEALGEAHRGYNEKVIAVMWLEELVDEMICVALHRNEER